MTITPGDVNTPGVVVRIKCGGGGMSYSSTRLLLADATSVAARFETDVVRAAVNQPFVTFTTEYGDVRVRADRVTAIEVIHLLPRFSVNGNGNGKETRPVVQTGETR